MCDVIRLCYVGSRAGAVEQGADAKSGAAGGNPCHGGPPSLGPPASVDFSGLTAVQTVMHQGCAHVLGAVPGHTSCTYPYAVYGGLEHSCAAV